MSKPGFFDRTQRIHTHAQMQAKLAERTGKPVEGGSGEPLEITGVTSRTVDPDVLDSSKPAPTPAALVWDAPVKATQNTVCGRYEIRGARLKDSLLYYAWSMREGIPKLLGYPSTPDAARALCQTHADAS